MGQNLGTGMVLGSARVRARQDWILAGMQGPLWTHGGGGRALRDPTCPGWGWGHSNTCSLHRQCPSSTREPSPGNPVCPSGCHSPTGRDPGQGP